MKIGMQLDKFRERAKLGEDPSLRTTSRMVILLTSLCISLILFLVPARASALTKNSLVVLPALQLTVGFEDDSRVNYWTPVQVTLSNEGSNFSGMISVTTYAGFSRQVVVGNTLPWSYQVPVVLPHGTQKQINFNIPFYETPAVPQGIVATLSDSKGKVITSQTATPLYYTRVLFSSVYSQITLQKVLSLAP